MGVGIAEIAAVETTGVPERGNCKLAKGELRDTEVDGGKKLNGEPRDRRMCGGRESEIWAGVC